MTAAASGAGGSRDAVVVAAVRTAIGRRGGALHEMHPVDLLAEVLAAAVERARVDPALVDDVLCGCVSQVGEQGLNIGRNAWLAAGLPEEVPAATIDRQCGSSQQAVHFAAQGVVAGAYDVAVACGVESMSRVPLRSSVAVAGSPLSPRLTARYGGRLGSQGEAAELVAARFELSRTELDDYGARSHELAGAAVRRGAFAAEIHPVKVAGDDGPVLVERDEGVRVPDRAKMAALEPAFVPGGVVTAANSSQISDGAAAIVIASRAAAERLGLPVRARIAALALAASDPVAMLTAPMPATDKVLARAGLGLGDLGAVEINEAFASVVLAWRRKLAIDAAWFEDHVNVNGGAIALGHPVGASGARLLATLLGVLDERGARYGLQVMCEGGGLANALVAERIG